jgi:NAD(P)-dependent dehydrogenase (short-subunit alcohol dehydrogenase family)
MGMAKGAVDGLTLSLAAELAPKVRVNSIAPSLTRTPLASSILSNEQVAAAVGGLHALERLGTPEDIAALSAFLLSPEADWITGQTISVDGGRSTIRTKG